MTPCSGLAGDRGERSRVISCSVSFPPPSSPSRKTIEDVWRDISLSFLRDRDPISIPAAILQDFMSGQRKPALRGAREPAPAAAPEPVALLDSPATCLSLSSGCHEATMTMTMADAALHAADMEPYSRKRSPDTRDDTCNRRHKRQIKNRESAARSRARRQAYTMELEMEVERLKQENAKLRHQLEKFLSTTAAPAADRLPKKSRLQRTSTSPF